MSWEDIFQNWAKPPGDTEQSKCENAEKAIRTALKQDSALISRRIEVFPQGSYRNRTNVREDSDVDICSLCSDTFFYDLPEGKSAADFGISVPAAYEFPTYKNEVEVALKRHFGMTSVKRGKKAFDIHENTYRVDADVVPAFEYRRFDTSGGYLKGTAFLVDSGNRIVNWPQQNYENGVRKNEETNRRFKAVVRIIKRLRNEMDDKGNSSAKPISSYLIECLVWNVPNVGFGHETLYEDVRYALAHLFNKTIKAEDCNEWGEINELKYLFRTSQPWTREQTHSFLSAAWDYVGYK